MEAAPIPLKERAMDTVAMFAPTWSRGGPPSKTLPKLPAVTKINDRVWRILGGNPSMFTLQGTNTYLVGTGKRRVLIDAGDGLPVYLEYLEQCLSLAGAEGIQEIVLTHYHPDHMGGCVSVQDKYGTPEAPVPVKKVPCRGGDGKVRGDLVPIKDGDLIETEGATLEVMFTPGHSRDHVCFLLREDNLMFGGDNILNGNTSVFEDMTNYMSSLERMLAEGRRMAFSLGRDKFTILSSHGDTLPDGGAEVEMYIKHRQVREAAIDKCLTDAGGQALSVGEIVDRVYGTHLGFMHKQAACEMVWHVCSHLVDSNRLERAPNTGFSKWFQDTAGFYTDRFFLSEKLRSYKQKLTKMARFM